MGADTADRDAIVVRARRADDFWAGLKAALKAALTTCRERPRDTIAGTLVSLTLLTGLFPVATTAAADDTAPALDASALSAEVPEEVQVQQLLPLPTPAIAPIPVGKGMWVHKVRRAENGDAARIVNQAKAAGLTHIYVRTGSSKSGFHGKADLDSLLPVAHEAGLKVVGWDFPYLFNVADDVERARQAIWYATPSGHRIDAFSADIETPAEGTNLTAEGVAAYGAALRQAAGAGYPLIATVPRPSPKRWFPFDQLGAFDAVAPMVYWGNRDPGTDVAGAIAALAPLGKPILPVGQAYDMALDGARGRAAGSPSREAIERFIHTATDHGALGVSFWVWDTADPHHWDAITASDQLDLEPVASPVPPAPKVALLQRVLNGLGHPTPVDGMLNEATASAVSEFQRREGVPANGKFDKRTLDALLKPKP